MSALDVIICGLQVFVQLHLEPRKRLNESALRYTHGAGKIRGSSQASQPKPKMKKREGKERDFRREAKKVGVLKKKISPKSVGCMATPERDGTNRLYNCTLTYVA